MATDAPVVVMPLYDGVDILDVTGPYEMFRWAGFETRLLAKTAGGVTCNGGVVLQAQRAFGRAEPIAALWTPGGAPDALRSLMYGPDRSYLDFLIAQSAQATWVASVCEGALLLAAAKLLDGYEVTTHWAFVPCLKRDFTAVRVVEGHPRFCLDRNRLTGGGISSGLDEALQLIRLVKGEACAKYVQQMTQYYPSPPVCSVIPEPPGCPLDETGAPVVRPIGGAEIRIAR